MWCGALCPRLVSCVALVQAAVYNQTTQGNYMMCKGTAASTITGCRESLSTPHGKATVRERVQRGLLLIKRAQQYGSVGYYHCVLGERITKSSDHNGDTALWAGQPWQLGCAPGHKVWWGVFVWR